MKVGKFAETLAKIQVTGIICYIRDIQRNVLPNFIEICMEMPYWCPFEWTPTLLMETNRNIEFYRVLLQKREFIPRGTHKHYN